MRPLQGERRCAYLIFLALLCACAGPDPRAPDDDGSSPSVAAHALPASASSEQAFADFDRWLRGRGAVARRGRASDEAQRGVQLAVRRKAALQALTHADPEAAVARALPSEVVSALPPEVARHVEQPLDARGDFMVRAMVPRTAGPRQAPTHMMERFVVVDGTTYPAMVFGRRLAMPSKYDIPLHGFVLDGMAALSALPARVIARDGDAVIANVGGVEQTLASVGVFDDFVNRQMTLEAMPGPRSSDAGRSAEASSWTRGPKRLLYMRVDFSDMPGEPMTLEQARASLDETSAFVSENSAGTTWLSDAIITPVLRLPQTAAFYAYDSSRSFTLLDDARAAALAAGYDTNEYDFDMVAFGNLGYPWGGYAFVGARGAWLQNEFNLRVTGHELGHNYGVWHANYWSSSDYTPFGPGQSWEYGNPFDLMGGGHSAAHHFDVPHKVDLGWLTSAEVPVVTDSGTYRIFAHDLPGARGVLGVQIPRDPGRSLYLEYRARTEEEPPLQDGIMAVWSDPYWNALIDSTPSDNNAQNAVLALGRTMFDPLLGTYITPQSKAWVAGQPALDVVLQRGPFPDNRAPTLSVVTSDTVVPPAGTVSFSATAVDADGDPLSYFWDFGDGRAGASVDTVSRVFPDAGIFVTRLEVSDTKGGRASRNILIRVGDTPYQGSITGVVSNDSGTPLEGVPVHQDWGASSTDSDGRYYLSVWAGTHRVSASSGAASFTPHERVIEVAGGQHIVGADFQSSPTSMRIDAASHAPYVDASQLTWQADLGFADGLTVDRGPIDIEGTHDDRLYQTERYAVSSYAVPIANGSYTVKLHFAETYDGIGAPGQRVFAASVEASDLGSIDVFARTGARNRALVVQTNVKVEDGVLDVRFTPIIQNTLINAIEVAPADKPEPIRVECGGDAPYRDVAGQTWESDRGHPDGHAFDRGSVPIEWTDDDRLFQTERYAVSSYSFAVPNGLYQTTLHFAETYEGITGPGQRIFHAAVNGAVVFDIDPFAWTGGLRRPTSTTWTTNVSDGVLHITFTPVVQNTLVNAIEIVPAY